MSRRVCCRYVPIPDEVFGICLLTSLIVQQPNPDYVEEDTSSTYRGAGGSLVGGMTVSMMPAIPNHVLRR